jgi:hypothetical protein
MPLNLEDQEPVNKDAVSNNAVNRDVTNRNMVNRDVTNRNMVNRDITNRDITEIDEEFKMLQESVANNSSLAMTIDAVENMGFHSRLTVSCIFGQI